MLTAASRTPSATRGRRARARGARRQVRGGGVRCRRRARRRDVFPMPGQRRASAGSGAGSASASGSTHRRSDSLGSDTAASIASGYANTNRPARHNASGRAPAVVARRRGGIVAPASLPLVPGTPRRRFRRFPRRRPPLRTPPRDIAIVRAGRSRAVRRLSRRGGGGVHVDLPPASRSATRAPGDSWRARGGETAAEDAKDEDASAPDPIAAVEEKETVAVDVSACPRSAARSLRYDDDISDAAGETAAASEETPARADAVFGRRARPVAPAALTPSPPRAVPSTPERPVPRGTVKEAPRWTRARAYVSPRVTRVALRRRSRVAPSDSRC